MHARVKPGFIGRQGSSDRSFYVCFTALPIDTCSERSYPFVFATNLLSDTALKICIARVITPWSHCIKASSRALTRILKTGVQDSHLAKSRSPTGKSGSPTPKKLESHLFVHTVYLFHFSRKWYILNSF